MNKICKISKLLSIVTLIPMCIISFGGTLIYGNGAFYGPGPYGFFLFWFYFSGALLALFIVAHNKEKSIV